LRVVGSMSLFCGSPLLIIVVVLAHPCEHSVRDLTKWANRSGARDKVPESAMNQLRTGKNNLGCYCRRIMDEYRCSVSGNLKSEPKHWRQLVSLIHRPRTAPSHGNH
jgi:hypothetical protein